MFLFRYLALAVAGSAAYSMSTLFSAMKPVLLTRLVEQADYSERLAGLAVAMPFVGIALAAFAVHSVIERLSYRQIVMVFGALLAAAELASVWLFPHALALLGVQLAGGLSVGILMGATSREIARSSSPARLFGFVDMMAVLLMSAMVFGVGLSVEWEGLRGGYGFAAAVAAALTLAMLLRRARAADDDVPARPSSGERATAIKLTLKPLAVVGMGVVFVTFSGLGFAFMFTLARDLGMSYDDAGWWIGVLLFFSAFACQAGGWASARYGPRRPLGLAFVVCAVGWYLAVNATSVPVFFAGLVPAIFALQFNFPVLLSLAGTLDNDGQWAGIASPLLTSGFAWAAIVAGQLVGVWGLAALAIGTICGMLVCLGLLWLSR